jgi:hypothetical protein
MIGMILLVIAASCSALMDTHAHHWASSVMPRWGWWWRQESWRNKYKDGDYSKGRTWWPVQITDGWHFAKMVMIFAVCAALALPQSKSIYHFLGWFAAYGVVWNITFNILYNRILNKK